MLTLRTYEAAAKGRLPGPVWDFLAGGSGTESMLTAGREALDRIRLRPRCLVDVSRCDPGTELLGARLAAPLGIAPMAYHRLADPEGEVATARSRARPARCSRSACSPAGPWRTSRRRRAVPCGSSCTGSSAAICSRTSSTGPKPPDSARWC